MAFTAITLASLAALVVAAPTPSRTVNKRAATSECAQYASTTAGAYTLNNDLWGEDNGSGSQCYTLDSSAGDSIGWTTTWSWSGGANNVKSYNNAVYGFTKSKLSDVSSMPSKWDWSYTGDSLVADVSYDLFTSSTADGSEEYEIMIWLAALGGAGPISASYDASGKPVAIASTTVGGHTFNLYKGTNGIQKATYSFIASEQVTSFSGDINDFLTYLVKSQNFDSSQYLVSVGAGTEAFTGSNAKFTVSSYSIAVTLGSSSGSAASDSASAAPAPSSSAAASAVSSAGNLTASAATSVEKPASYTVPSSASRVTPVAPITTAAAPSSTLASSAATSVAAVSTEAAPSVAPSPQPYSAPAPTETASPDSGCDVEYVYV